MSQESIQHVLDQIRGIEDIVEGEDQASLPMPFVYRTTVHPPVAWSKETIESTLEVTLPDDLIHLWNQAAGLSLYKDISYGQWGLTIWSPEEILTEHPQAIKLKLEEDIFKGDLIIGRLIGDSDYPILRCDPALDDFGEIIIALALDPRKDWPVVASSLTEYLERAAPSIEYQYWFRGRKS